MQHHPHHLWRRGAVALALVMGLLALMSSPASAATASITSGTVTIGTESFTIGGGGPPDKCTAPLPTQSINVSFFGNATSGTWTISGSFKARFRLAAPNDAQYWQADITILTGSGTYSGGPSSYTLTSNPPSHITLEAKIYRLTPPGCAKTDLACTMRTRVVVTGTFTGTLPVPSPGDTLSLSGTSNTAGGVPVTVVGGACPATITSQLVGKHVSFTLSFTF